MLKNLKKILILADSLGLPKNENEDIVRYSYTWPSLLNQNLKNFEIINHSVRKRTIIVTKNQLAEIIMIEPHLVIFQIGVVDCAPRIFSLNDQKWLKRFPNFIKYYIINLRKNRRAKIQTENPLSKVYVKPELFKKTYLEIIVELKHEFENFNFTNNWRQKYFRKKITRL